jgi:hypothetical protein
MLADFCERSFLKLWSYPNLALRYAAASKPSDESIKKFIKRKGGINACAMAYAPPAEAFSATQSHCATSRPESVHPQKLTYIR